MKKGEKREAAAKSKNSLGCACAQTKNSLGCACAQTCLLF